MIKMSCRIGYICRWNPLKYMDKPKSPWINNEIKKWRELGYDVSAIGWKEEDVDINKVKQMDFIICHHADSIKYIYRSGKPFIVISHAWDIWKDNGEELKRYTQSKKCKGIGYISDYHLRKYKEWGIEGNFIDTPVNINLNKFKRTKPLGDKIITGGRLAPKKGFEYTLKAIPDITVYGGVWNEDYANKIKSISNRATFTGYLEDKELVNLLNDGWLFVFTGVKLSNKNADGIPTTVKEALAMEMQVIASPVHGTVDLKDYVTFVDPKDTEGIKKAVKSLPKKRNIEGRKFVEKKYGIEVFIKNVKPLVDKYA